MKKNYLLSAFALSLFCLACGKDRNLEDYNRHKAMEDDAKIESVTGTYRGELRSLKTNQAIGVIQVDLTKDRKVDSLNFEQTTLKTTVFFSGKSPIYLSSTHTYYDWKNGRFNSEFQMPLSSDRTLSLQMVGTLEVGKLKGEFNVDGYSEYAGEFTLERLNRPSSAESYFRSGQIARQLRGNDEIEVTYNGELPASNGENYKSLVSLLVSNSDVNPGVRFAEMFSPQKTVRAVLTIRRQRPTRSSGPQGGFSLTFTAGTWEPSLGTLIADYQSQNPMDRSHFSLRCSAPETEDASGPPKIDCRYQSSERGISADFHLTQERPARPAEKRAVP